MFKRILVLTLLSLLLFGTEVIDLSSHQIKADDTDIAQTDGWVMFNIKSYKFHNPRCRWAKKCTVNCIRIKYSEARAKDGVPCKVCGGVPQ